MGCSVYISNLFPDQGSSEGAEPSIEQSQGDGETSSRVNWQEINLGEP